MNSYFDLAYFWRDAGLIMSLSLPELELYIDQTTRLLDAGARR